MITIKKVDSFRKSKKVDFSESPKKKTSFLKLKKVDFSKIRKIAKLRTKLAYKSGGLFLWTATSLECLLFWTSRKVYFYGFYFCELF